MHNSRIISLLYFSAVSELVSGAAILQPASIERRSIQLGWSLQASTCPSVSTSCGDGACCPSRLFCITNANDEVDACCTTSKSHWLTLCFLFMLIHRQTRPAEDQLKGTQCVQIPVGLCGRVSKEMASAAKQAWMGSTTPRIPLQGPVFLVLHRLDIPQR
jgi:hypothetical protein